MRLTPEQVAKEKKYLSELKERVWFGEHGLTSAEQDLFDTIEALQQENEQLQELAKAKADGRLVVLPCKVGETIWKIKAVFSYFSKPMEDRVERIIISSNEILVCCTSGTKFSVNSIGKTVFLTREEAEKVLEAKQGGGKKDE